MSLLSRIICLALLFSFTSCVENDGPITVPPSNNEPSDVFLNKKYTEATFLMTHNAYNSSDRGYGAPNQTHRISKQLVNGVRGLMLDTYDGPNGVAEVYHSVSLMGKEPLVNVLDEVRAFLESYPYDIVTIIFENNGGNNQLIKAIEDADLVQYAYYHNGTWPTLKDMIESGQRLVLFTESTKSPRPDYLLSGWSYIFDTEYTFKNVSEFNCKVNRGGNGTKELYLVNHWLNNPVGLPDKNLASKANNMNTLMKRLTDCSTENNKKVNFVGVDFYEIGAGKAVVDALNGL